MNDSKPIGTQGDDAETHVELTPGDLIALSSPKAVNASASCHGVAVSSRDARQLTSTSHKSVSQPDKSVARTAAAIGLPLTAAIAGGLLYAHHELNREQAADQTAAARIVSDLRFASLEPEPEPEPEGKPVRFRNPFDASEVFEFPPGTTREEAREKVAEVLVERAAARVR